MVAAITTVGRPADAAIQIVPLPTPASQGTYDIAAVDRTGRFVVITELVRSGKDEWLAPQRVDRLSGVITPLPAARAVSADGTKVITPDGRWLDTATSASTAIPAAASVIATRFALSADGTSYLWRSDGGSTLTGGIVDGPTGVDQPLPSGGWPLAISSNGRYVLYGVNCPRESKYNLPRCDSWRWDRTTGNTSFVAPSALTAGSVHAVTEIADNGRVLLAATDDVHWMIDDPGGRRAVPYPVTDAGYPYRLSANGRYLLSTETDQCCNQSLIDLDTAARVRAVRFPEGSQPTYGYFSLSGDGSTIVSVRVSGTPPNATYELSSTPGLAPPAVANVHAGAVLAVPVNGTGGVATDASAVMLNVTVTNPTADGFVTVWPCGEPQPGTSNLNFVAGQTVANAVLARPGASGRVCAASNVDTDLVVDVQGSFAAAGSGYQGLLPSRVADTRHGQGTSGGVGQGKVLEVPLTGSGGVPGDASAVVLNVTATNPSAAGFLTVWPCGETQPLASNLNFGAGQTVAVAAIVAVRASRTICATSNVAVDVVVDAEGSFGPLAPYHALTPVRLLDTRVGGPATHHVAALSTVVLPVAGIGGVGADATAALLSVTAVDPSADAFVTVWPCGRARPLASNLNVAKGRTAANAVLAATGGDGAVCLAASADTDLVVDVEGWLGAGSRYDAVTPARIIDTR